MGWVLSTIIWITIWSCLLRGFELAPQISPKQIPCDKTRKVFTDSWGIISDGPLGSNYTQDSHCEWLIKANNSRQFITLSFRTMGTECSYDYVFVYDGDSFRSPLLGSFSGKTEPQQVTSSSGYMLILLYSDTNYVLDGFHAEFSVTNCSNNCTNHGKCIDNTCFCEDDWGGRDCSRALCPNNCSYSGKCDLKRCHCHNGYSGQSCSLHKMHQVELDSRFMWRKNSHNMWLDEQTRSQMRLVEFQPHNTFSFALNGTTTEPTWNTGPQYIVMERYAEGLAQDKHELHETKFHIALRAIDPVHPEISGRAAYGMIFFRQDQLHIDLFVFFSVFFSCFFLFLAGCVVAWKTKQAADVRRARRRHVVEMLHMAKRPFASATIIYDRDGNDCNPSSPQRKSRRNKLVSFHSDVRPVAVEPTDDGVAAVATVFIRLPGGRQAPVKLALGSSLILLTRVYPVNSRVFLRRRNSHALN